MTVHSVRELFKFKSFFLLIFLLLAANKLLRIYITVDRTTLDLPDFGGLGLKASAYVFEQLPMQLAGWLADYRVLITLVGLFLLKQIISLWPSSDMRRMHRAERGRFGIIGALTAIRWHQVVWDAVAVATICGVIGVWSGVSYGTGLVIWRQSGSPAALVVLAVLTSMSLPIGMAGFSYSSKLAVIKQGRFGQKLGLFFKLLSDWRVFWTSWIFFSCRILLEALFVVVIPTGAILLISDFWLRMAVAAISATPVYSYLKMASFKFFLDTYSRFPLVQNEYRDYFKTSV